MTKAHAWWQFTKERFEPASHLTMIVVFLFAHVLIAKASGLLVTKPLDHIILLIGVLAFYFKLRLYDEVKDYDLDVVINKHRPLPRGLLTHDDMFRGMGTCIAIELVCFSYQGTGSAFSVLIAIFYSLLMYKEFFIPEKIRPFLTTYALLHTVVTTLLTFAIFSFLTGSNFFSSIKNPAYVFFALTNWMLFNIFEFGRKTFSSTEERPNVDTYSSLFGRTGAVVLVFSQALIAHFLMLSLQGANDKILFFGLGLLLGFLGVLSLFYIITDKVQAAKLYRVFSSLYIILFYLILIFSYSIEKSS